MVLPIWIRFWHPNINNGWQLVHTYTHTQHGICASVLLVSPAIWCDTLHDRVWHLSRLVPWKVGRFQTLLLFFWYCLCAKGLEFYVDLCVIYDVVISVWGAWYGFYSADPITDNYLFLMVDTDNTADNFILLYFKKEVHITCSLCSPENEKAQDVVSKDGWCNISYCWPGQI